MWTCNNNFLGSWDWVSFSLPHLFELPEHRFIREFHAHVENVVRTFRVQLATINWPIAFCYCLPTTSRVGRSLVCGADQRQQGPPPIRLQRLNLVIGITKLHVHFWSLSISENGRLEPCLLQFHGGSQQLFLRGPSFFSLTSWIRKWTLSLGWELCVGYHQDMTQFRGFGFAHFKILDSQFHVAFFRLCAWNSASYIWPTSGEVSFCPLRIYFT